MTRSGGQTDQKTLRLKTASELNSQRSRYGSDIPAVSKLLVASDPAPRTIDECQRKNVLESGKQSGLPLWPRVAPRRAPPRTDPLLALPHVKLSIHWVLRSSLMGL